MMTRLFGFLAAIAASFALAAPAMAQDSENFDGLRVGVLAGITGDDFATDDAEFTYGAVVGYDLAVLDNLLVGVEADIADVDDGISDRQISAAVRVTYPLNDRVAVFGSAGYTNLSVEFAPNVDVDFDGYRVGGGAEVRLSDTFYASAEYRYSDFDLNGFGDSGVHSALVGVGARF